MKAKDRDHLERAILAVRSEAVNSGRVPLDVADTAASATRRAFARAFHGGEVTARVRAYFWAVVRRSASRAPQGRDLSARFVLAAAVADLQAGGRSPREVWERISEDWSGRLPDTVLHEFESRLCA